LIISAASYRGAVPAATLPLYSLQQLRARFADETKEEQMHSVVTVLAAAVLAFAPIGASAQGFPSKPVSIVIPSPPGGLQDTLSRAIASEISKKWGQPVLVENRTGGNAIIAGQHVVKSAPDGHTIFMSSVVQLSNDLIPNRSVPFDPVKDFTPVIALAEAGTVLVVSTESPYRNLRDLVAAARARPGELNYGSYGVGSLPHIDTEALNAREGMKVVHIPYKGGPETIVAVQSGQITFTLTSIPPALSHIRGGRLRALALAGLKRSASLPDVPTFTEEGVKGFASGGWFGWFVPAKTPSAIVSRIAADASSVITAPAFRAKFIDGAGLELVNLQTTAFEKQLHADRESYKARLKGIEVQLR
jgi:tripartite-type tricarboxylate transporter receptor subunit TctC